MSFLPAAYSMDRNIPSITVNLASLPALPTVCLNVVSFTVMPADMLLPLLCHRLLWTCACSCFSCT